MGPLKKILGMMPGMGQNSEMMDSLQGDEFGKMEAVIHSMTPAERDDPSIIEASRRRRIAKGSGTQVTDVSGLVKSFTQADKMMNQISVMGMRERMAFAKQMGEGGMAGGGMPGKVKQRSKRLTAKQRARKKGGKKRKR